MKKKTKASTQKEFDAMARAVARYIKAMGGHAVVIGGVGVQERPPLKMNYTLHIDFTGKPPTAYGTFR